MSLPSFETQTLKCSCAVSAGGLTARLDGAADLAVQDGLNTFMLAVHAAAQTAKARGVDVDLKPLRFMSSSCFKVFITWLTSLQQLPELERYRVCFLSDPSQHWQRRSLTALAAFGGDLVEVRT